MGHAAGREGEREGARFPNYMVMYCTCTIVLDAVQWNISNLDTNGAEQSNEVSSFNACKSGTWGCLLCPQFPIQGSTGHLLHALVRDTAGVYYT